MIEDAKVPSQAVEHRELLRGVTSHDVGVFVVRRLAAISPVNVEM